MKASENSMDLIEKSEHTMVIGSECGHGLMKEQEVIPTKKCPKCGRELPTTMFYTNIRNKDGFQDKCKDCQREWNREYNKRKKEEKRLASLNVEDKVETKKVIVEHSTVGIIVTTDGTITDIPREEYSIAEERVVNELKEINKPFIMLMNTQDPNSSYAISYAEELSQKYNATVIPINCLYLSLEDINLIFSKLLYEFYIEKLEVKFPRWIETLSLDNSIKLNLFNGFKDTFDSCKRLKDIKEVYLNLENIEEVKKVTLDEINLGTGEVKIDVELNDALFYNVLTDITGINIQNEGELFSYISEFSKIKKEYDKMAYAIHEVTEKGYGIVTPSIEDLILDEPEIVKQGNKYGVKLKAKAPSIHMIKIDTETEVSPIVGSEKQSEELLNYLRAEFENHPKKIWNSNIFGKNLHELVNEGLQNKLAKMPEEAQMKLQETLQRIVNEGSGGLICIIL